MRKILAGAVALLGTGWILGCVPGVWPGADGDIISVSPIVVDPNDASPKTGPDDPTTTNKPSDANPSSASDPNTSSDDTPAEVSYRMVDTLEGAGNYRLYELGAGAAGDAWSIYTDGPLQSGFVVVLFDEDMDMQARVFISSTNPLEHVLRESTGNLLLGVMPPGSGGGGEYRLIASRERGVSIPQPRTQVVYLNFAGGSGVVVNSRDAQYFPAFNAQALGEEYAGHTSEIKAAILRQMREDYAGYSVTIVTSDDGPPPSGPYSTIHFGGSAPGLLGLADNVDGYNRNLEQDAMIYVENFSRYWTMKLTADEMAVMVANVASHELGHLLGLYHTTDPTTLMDTTGSAWELAEDQAFGRGPLEETVFATGWENSPTLLQHTVGTKSSAARVVAVAPAVSTFQDAIYAEVRRFAAEETACGCGTCRVLDNN